MNEIKDRGPGRSRRTDKNVAVDNHVGQRVRLRRTLLGMSMEKLGETLGLSYQQLQKYERGGNRISASRLVELSGALDVPVSFFFDGLDDGQPPPANPDLKRWQLETIRRMERLPEGQRKAVFDLIAALAAEADGAAPSATHTGGRA